MQRFFFFLFTFSFFLNNNNIFAQPRNPGEGLNIMIVDSLSKEPIPYAAIAVYLAENNTLIDGGLTDETGKCTLSKVKLGTFNIKINSVGYKNLELKNININKYFLRLRMVPTSVELKEAVVTAEKNAIVQQIDKKVVNLEQLNANRNGTLGEVLANIPSLNVDQDGTLTMRGSQDINIMIDGKPNTMSALALMQLPATSVESVELITNPSAKYEAAGTAGILNIITKKSRKDGYNGTATLGVSTWNTYNTNLNLNTKKNKLATNLNVGFRHSNITNYKVGKREFSTENPFTFLFSDNGRNIRDNLNLRMGLDYSFNKHHTITANGSFNTGKSNSTSNNFYTRESAFETLNDEKYDKENQKENNYSVGLGYKITFDKPKHNIVFDVLSVNGNEDKNMDYDYIYDDARSFQSVARKLDKNDLMNYQIDYTLPFSKNTFLEAGMKKIDRYFETNASQVQTGFTEFQSFNYTFDFEDHVHAIYSAFNTKVDKWGFNAGLRFENTDYSFQFLSDTSIQEKNTYFNFFPSTFVSYSPNEQLSFQIGYSKRINRPGMNSLNPFQDTNDPYSLRKGNPDLQPELIHSLEWNTNKYTKWGSWGTSVFFRKTVNSFIRYVNTDTVTNITSVQINNGDALNNYGGDLNFTIKPTSIWNINFSNSLFISELLDDTLKRNILVYKTNLMSSWKVFPSSNFQIAINYSSPFITPQGKIDGFNSVDISWKQMIMKEKASITFSVNDFFNTRQFHVRGNEQFVSYDFVRKRQSRVANLTFTYNFGALELKSTRRKTPDIPRNDDGGGF